MYNQPNLQYVVLPQPEIAEGKLEHVSILGQVLDL